MRANLFLAATLLLCACSSFVNTNPQTVDATRETPAAHMADGSFALIPKNKLSETTMRFIAVPFTCIKSVKPRALSIYPGASGRIDIETDTQGPCADKSRRTGFDVIAKTTGIHLVWYGIMTFVSRPDGSATLELRGEPPRPFCTHPDLFGSGYTWNGLPQRIEFDKCPLTATRRNE